MKSISVMAVTLFSQTVFAAPMVGDFARFHVHGILPNGAQGDYEVKSQITALDSNTYTFKTSAIINGAVYAESSDMSLSPLRSAADYCAQSNEPSAKIETIKVPAGTFEVCHTHFEFSGKVMDLYDGAILFGGRVKAAIPGGQTDLIELIELVQH